MPTARLLDGKFVSAPTWSLLEEVYRSTFMNAIIPEDEFRETLRERAKTWSGTVIATDGDSEDFFLELERAGLVLRVSANIIADDPTIPVDANVPRIVYLNRQAELKAARDAVKNKKEALPCR